MNFGALSRGFGTCCLRFKNRVATIPAKLASGWLARLYREGVDPSGSLQKVSDHISRPRFLDLSWRKGSFILNLPAHHSITSSARASNVGGIMIPRASSACYSSPEPATGSNLPTQPNTKPSHTLLQSILTRLQFSPNLANLCKLYAPFFFLRKTNLEW